MSRNRRHTLARTAHDVGLAAWFGGSLMGAVGVNGAVADLDDPGQRARAANSAWGRWTPVNAAAIGLHLAGAVTLLRADKGRITGQKGVAGMSVAKTGLTAAALAATAYSRTLGEKVMQAGDTPVEAGAVPSSSTPPEVAKAQQQLRALQWAIPGLTGGVVALSALAGEQQRPSQVLAGAVKGLPARAAKAAKAGAAAGSVAAVAAKEHAVSAKDAAVARAS